MHKEDNIIEIQEEVKIGEVVLEKGDKIEILEAYDLPARDMPVNQLLNNLINKMGAEEVLRNLVSDFMSGRYSSIMRRGLEDLYLNR